MGTADGQVAHLSEHGSDALEIEAGPGDTLLIDVGADLGRHRVSGISVYLQVPTDGFRILQEGTAGPFEPGDLFEGAIVVRNQVITDGTVDPSAGYRLIEFTTLFGPGSKRGHSGAGSIACFRMVCERVMAASIRLHRSPVHESRVVLADGRTEMPLFISPPVQIHVDLDTAVRALPWAMVKRLPGQAP